MSVVFDKNEDCAVASAEAIAAFERECGVNLPTDYRGFLSSSPGGSPTPDWSSFGGRGGDIVMYVYGIHQGAHWKRLSYAVGVGMVHVRSLDWPLATMGAATCLFRFRRGAREFVSVGVPGHVGVLSGMLPQSYSATINWAPAAAIPSFEFWPAFLLRDTLETCDSYEAAVEKLTQTRLSTSVFFTVCGTSINQACVIERTQSAAAVRKMAGPVLVQANHHVAECFGTNNEDILEGAGDEDVFSLEGSKKRADILSRTLAEIPTPYTSDTIANALNSGTVLNQDTCQQMVFYPGSGEIKVWRRAADSTQ